VNETTNQIEKAFVERVVEKDWLDQTTKDQCVEKVQEIVLRDVLLLTFCALG